MVQNISNIQLGMVGELQGAVIKVAALVHVNIGKQTPLSIGTGRLFPTSTRPKVQILLYYASVSKEPS